MGDRGKTQKASDFSKKKSKSCVFRDCLVISDGNSMVFGTVDDIQKIHVRSIPMGESVLRIAYQKSTSTYGVCSNRTESKAERVFASKNALVTSQSRPKGVSILKIV